MGSLQQAPELVAWCLLVTLALFGLLALRHRQKPHGPSRVKAHVQKVNESLDRPRQQSGSPKMQILFFHGIPSHDFSDVHLTTWCHRDGFLWPQDWLPEEDPGMHIFFVKYNVSLVNFHMNNIGENLVSDLLDAKIGRVRGCPVVLVGHCIGGLVIKELCVKAHQEFHSTKDLMDGRAKKLAAFLDNVKGVFFYGTPHHGIREIGRASHLLRSPLFKFFETLSTDTAVLNSNFTKLSKIYSKWKIRGVGESLPVKSGVFRNILVVEEASAREGDEIFTTLSEDHFSVCKPEGKFSGGFYHLTNLLDDIAKEEIRSQQHMSPENLQYLPDSIVGIEILVQEVKGKLKDVSMLGLTGMGGSGKSTLASAIFNDLCVEFEYTCFVRDVKFIGGRVDTLKEKVWEYMHHNGKKVGGGMNWSQLRGKRLLFILDDISNEREIQALLEIAQGPSQESRFIATCRESDLFQSFYTVPFLDQNNAKQLFISFAFPNNETVPSKLAYLAEKIVKKCNGLPLTLEVLGKWLKKTKDEEEWKQTLDALDKAESVKNFNERLWAKLKPSIDGLEEKEKQMFLDVVTFFDNYDSRKYFYWTLREAQAAWRETYGVNEKVLWRTLVERSLVYDVKEDQVIKVHEQLRSLGKKIVRESYKGSRVLEISSAMKVLLSTDEMDKKDIHALRLAGSQVDTKDVDALQSIVAEVNLEENIYLDRKVRVASLGLQKLEKLRYLDVDNDFVSDEDATTNWFPSSLVVLNCVGMKALDLGHQRRLVVLKISDPDLIFLPNSVGQLSALRILLLNCASLRSIPEEMGDLSKLEVLKIFDGGSVQNLPTTLGQLVELKILLLGGCENLDALPESFGHLSALERLDFSLCGFKTLPTSFGLLSSLTYLTITLCSELESLPESFGLLHALTDLTISWCDSLNSIPETFSHLSALRRLEFYTCTSLQSLPKSLGNLRVLSRLRIRKCPHLQSLSESLDQLGQLEYLEISDCRNLDSLPYSLAKLVSLRQLIIKGLWSLKSIPDHIQNLPSLHTLELGELPCIKELPAWLAEIGKENLAWSVKVFRIEDRHFSLSRDESSTDRFELVRNIHEEVMKKVRTTDYEGALAKLEVSSFGIPKLDGFLLQEKGIIKRKMGDLNGALEDLTAAIECFSKEDDGQHHTYDCWKHRGYVKYLMRDMEGAEDDGTMALQLKVVYRGSVLSLSSRITQYHRWIRLVRPDGLSYRSLGEESVQYMHLG